MLRTRIVNATGSLAGSKRNSFQLWDLDGYNEKVILIEVKDINKTIQIKPLQNNVVLEIIDHKETERRVVVIPRSWRGTKVELIQINGNTITDTTTDNNNGSSENKDDKQTPSSDSDSNANFKQILIIVGIAVCLVIVIKLIKRNGK